MTKQIKIARSKGRTVRVTSKPAHKLDPATVGRALGAEHSSRKQPKAPPPEFRAIEFVETTLHDPIRDRWEPGCDEGGVRFYGTSSPLTHGKENGRWALQVRARVKTRGRGPGKHFAVGTASMSREDLLWLRSLVDSALRE